MTNNTDRGSVLPLILGFFLLALLVVGASVSLGQAFVQQRDLQDACDGAAASAAASAGDLDRGGALASGASLQFDDVGTAVTAYFARDPSRRGITYRAELTHHRHRITLRCRQRAPLAFGGLVGHPSLEHTAVSSARAAVVG
ncbi:pilus assembly protein TadG-related protein [Jatrophihabitans endophyticus]|uniref:pilus assembly protein TadG-related protein n=1 Tax=Jatrophihabitans endophyticus TaxID=1206085 RepID=UPI0019FC1A6A|nr:pilus assembly protein TadG-related protein [Jatrophihabitans endophyticus]MBE7186981.1 hypothetical protein [Jatrophihabitans endophyticus]